jgi:hypothetical protein
MLSSKCARVGDHVVIRFGFNPSALVHLVSDDESLHDSGRTVCNIPVVCTFSRSNDPVDDIVHTPVDCLWCATSSRRM